MGALFGWGKDTQGLCAVVLTGDGVCFARVARDPLRRPRVTGFEHRQWSGNDAELAAILGGLKRAHRLDRGQCTTLLDAGEYNLLLTEAPDVPRDELRSAIRWRIKDLIDIHIDEATLDVFHIPGDVTPGRGPSLYAVAARNAAIRRRVELIGGAGIDVGVVDIPEMAQRNLASLLPEDATGVLVLSLFDDGGLVTITRGGEIYLTRRIEDVNLKALRGAQDDDLFDRLVLEIQRSLDYFDSHFRQTPVAAVVLAPLPEPLPALSAHLRANLNVEVREMDLTQLLDWDQPPPPDFAHCVPALGAALRHEERAL